MRLSNAEHAYEIVGFLSKANEQRTITESRVRAMLDGIPPYSQTILRQRAESYRCNVNFREAEAIHSAAMTPYYDLFAEARYLADVGLQDDNKSMEVKNSKIATTEFDRMLRSYDGFDYNMQMGLLDMIGYGKGFIFWPDTESWWFKAIKQSRVLVPDNTSADIDSLELVVVRQSWMVHELYKLIRDKSAATDMGWNVAECMKEIQQANPDYGNFDTTTEIEENQKRIRNNDLYESIRSATVNAAHVLVREFNGKVSHLIVSETRPQTTTSGQKVDRQFMFKKADRFDNFRQVVGSMFFDLGDGTWHSIKGLLVKMYPFIEIKNRLSCSVIDNTFINLSVLVQPTTERAFQEAVLQQQGPVSIMRHGLEIQQWGLAGRMEEGLAVEQRLENKLQANIGQYRQTLQREKGNPETATKVKADVFKEQTLGKGSVNRLYQQLDDIYAEIYRRATLENLTDDNGGPNSQALDFRERCKKQGVTIQQLRKVKHVRAFRNIGNGSPFMRQQAIMETERLIPLMNDAGRQNWLDDAIAVSMNHEMVDRYNPKAGDKPGDDEVTARLQAAAMKDGVSPVLTDNQDHFIFAKVYMEEAANALRQMQSGTSSQQETLQFLNMVGAAVAQRLKRIPENHPRREEVKGLTQQWKKLAALVDKMMQKQQDAANTQRENQMNQQAMMSDQAQSAAQASREQTRKDQTAQADIERKNQKAAVDLQLKTQKTQHQMALADAMAKQKMRNESLTQKNEK